MGYLNLTKKENGLISRTTFCGVRKPECLERRSDVFYSVFWDALQAHNHELGHPHKLLGMDGKGG